MIIYSKQGGLSAQRKIGAGVGAGFTLVEMMVAVTLLSLVLVAIIPTFTVFSKSVAGLGNYALMSRESRSGLELISRDFHAAESLTLASSSEVTLTLPAAAGGGSVNYDYDASQRTFTRTATPASGPTVTRDLFDDVDEFNLLYYNKLGVNVSSSPSILSEAKSVQINAKLVKKVVSTDNTDYIISARFLMRNK